MIWSIISKSSRSVISRDVIGWRVSAKPSAKRHGFHFGTGIFAVVQSMTNVRLGRSADDNPAAWPEGIAVIVTSDPNVGRTSIAINRTKV
jgi:hypothetical protein